MSAPATHGYGLLHGNERAGVTAPLEELPPDEELPADAIPDEPPSGEPETVEEPDVALPEELPEADAGGVRVPSEDLPPQPMPGRTPKVARNDALQRSSGVRNLMVQTRRNDRAGTLTDLQSKPHPRIRERRAKPAQ